MAAPETLRSWGNEEMRRDSGVLTDIRGDTSFRTRCRSRDRSRVVVHFFVHCRRAGAFVCDGQWNPGSQQGVRRFPMRLCGLDKTTGPRVSWAYSHSHRESRNQENRGAIVPLVGHRSDSDTSVKLSLESKDPYGSRLSDWAIQAKEHRRLRPLRWGQMTLLPRLRGGASTLCSEQ